MQNKDEAELIAQVLSGDHDAYATLVNRYKNAVYHYCFAIILNEDAAEDIAQDTFIAAFYNLGRYNSQFRLSTWLFKIGTNKALNYIKRHGREIAAEDVAAQVVSTHRGPDRYAEDVELSEAVQRLEPKYRTVVSLYYWQGLSYREIAHIMDAPEGSVKGWMSRAKSQLRKELS